MSSYAWPLHQSHGNAQAMTRSAERVQLSAERATKEIQGTFAQLAGRVKSLYSPAA